MFLYLTLTHHSQTLIWPLLLVTDAQYLVLYICNTCSLGKAFTCFISIHTF